MEAPTCPGGREGKGPLCESVEGTGIREGINVYVCPQLEVWKPLWDISTSSVQDERPIGVSNKASRLCSSIQSHEQSI